MICRAGTPNVSDRIAARAASNSARPALFHSSGTQTYGELLARADAIAARLRSVLHNPAPRVALMCPNGPDYVALALGVMRAGADVAPGEIGELWLRGPGMFDAYLVPWCERAAVTDGGWFATGDLARQDEDGHVFLRGRRKSIINFGGIKFFPEEVEAVLDTHPGVRESRVSGEPHERWGHSRRGRDRRARPFPAAEGGGASQILPGTTVTLGRRP